MASKSKTPLSVEDDALLISARAYAWADRHGYSHSDISRGAVAGGLPNRGEGERAVTLAVPGAEVLAKVTELLSNPITVNVRTHRNGATGLEPDFTQTPRAIKDQITAALEPWFTTVTGGTGRGTGVWTFGELSWDEAAAAALIKAYGSNGDLPPASEDVNEARKLIVAKIRKWCSDNGICDAPNRCLKDVGLAEYFPRTLARVKVNLADFGASDGTVELTIHTNGDGTLKTGGDLVDEIRNALYGLTAKDRRTLTVEDLGVPAKA